MESDLTKAFKKGDVDAVLFLLKNKNLDIKKILIKYIYMGYDDDYIKFILKNSDIDPSFNKDELLKNVVARDKRDLFKILVKDVRVNPGNAIKEAVDFENVYLLKKIVDNPRTVVPRYDFDIISNAIEYGNPEIIKLLIRALTLQ